jgi:hypothetical protein|tara:strand:- start:355 stop:558 length:204 start_codon:yes stop_codon:yes gene_type:complete
MQSSYNPNILIVNRVKEKNLFEHIFHKNKGHRYVAKLQHPQELLRVHNECCTALIRFAAMQNMDRYL